MSNSKKYYWLKLKDNFFEGKAMKKLRKIAGGDTYTIIYLKLLLKSMKTDGKLYFDGIEETFCEELALDIDEDTENVKITVMYLQKVGLLKEVNEKEIELIEMQDMVGSETASAARVRRHRKLKNEQQKALQSNTQTLQSNTDVTKCNTEIEIEKEIEKDIDIEKEIKKERKKVSKKKLSSTSSKPEKSKISFDTLIDNFTENEQLREELKEHLKVRKQKKGALTNRALQLSLSKLDKIAADDYEKIKIVQNSIMNGWTGFFPLKPDEKKTMKKANYDIEAYERSNRELFEAYPSGYDGASEFDQFLNKKPSKNFIDLEEEND